MSYSGEWGARAWGGGAPESAGGGLVDIAGQADVVLSTTADLSVGPTVELAGQSDLVVGVPDSALTVNLAIAGTSNLLFGVSADLQKLVDLDADPGNRVLLRLDARGQLTIEVTPVAPPSDLVFVKRVSNIMPIPTLNSRGRPE